MVALSVTLSISDKKGLEIAIHWFVKKLIISLIEGNVCLFSTTSIDCASGRILYCSVNVMNS